MKIEKHSTGTTWRAETDIEEKALDYIKSHTPIFAVAHEYVITAYQAGYNQAVEDLKNKQEQSQT